LHTPSTTTKDDYYGRISVNSTGFDLVAYKREDSNAFDVNDNLPITMYCDKFALGYRTSENNESLLLEINRDNNNPNI
jgi:hypothetical protein